MHVAETRESTTWRRTLQHWLRKLVALVILGVACAWAYDWASAHLYPGSVRVGFGHGLAHGAMMPMALPGLLLGKDPVIYAETNTGRTYKLGYIVGINLCGLLFFGVAFSRPRGRPGRPEPPERDRLAAASVSAQGTPGTSQ